MGVLSSFVELLEENRLGSTKIQKIVYLSQTIHEIPLDFRFTLFNYGPYSIELSNEIENLEYQNILELKCDKELCHLHRTTRDLPNRAIKQKEQFIDFIHSTITTWGDYSTKDLELIATYIFIDRMKAKRGQYTQEELIKTVKDIKPKYSDRCEEVFITLESLYSFSSLRQTS